MDGIKLDKSASDFMIEMRSIYDAKDVDFGITVTKDTDGEYYITGSGDYYAKACEAAKHDGFQADNFMSSGEASEFLKFIRAERRSKADARLTSAAVDMNAAASSIAGIIKGEGQKVSLDTLRRANETLSVVGNSHSRNRASADATAAFDRTAKVLQAQLSELDAKGAVTVGGVGADQVSYAKDFLNSLEKTVNTEFGAGLSARWDSGVYFQEGTHYLLSLVSSAPQPSPAPCDPAPKKH